MFCVGSHTLLYTYGIVYSITTDYTQMSDASKSFTSLFHYLNDNITALNNSKFFAGLMIILLNISSKFVTIRLSKTMEAYLKYTFSRNILVFAIAWMGTRDIYIAAAMVLAFIVIMDYLLNENSAYCCLPEQFMEYHIALLDDNGNERISDEDIKKATDLLERAKKQREKEKTLGEHPLKKAERPVQTQQGVSAFY